MNNKVIYVKYNDELVGTLAFTKDKKVAFQYSENWIKNGFSISPISLPLSNKVFIPTKPYFNGLFGVFSDSLPDAWGNLLLEKILRKYKIDKKEFNVLDKL